MGILRNLGINAIRRLFNRRLDTGQNVATAVGGVIKDLAVGTEDTKGIFTSKGLLGGLGGFVTGVSIATGLDLQMLGAVISADLDGNPDVVSKGELVIGIVVAGLGGLAFIGRAWAKKPVAGAEDEG